MKKVEGVPPLLRNGEKWRNFFMLILHLDMRRKKLSIF